MAFFNGANHTATVEHLAFGAPCWVDPMSCDTAASRSFYLGVLGWGAGDADEQMGGYFQFFKDGVPVAGAAPNPSGGAMPDAWSVYLNSANADETLARASEHGGSVMLAGMKVADLGNDGRRTRPGASIGVWAPDQFRGFGRLGEPGAAVWFEHERLRPGRGLLP